MNDALNEHGFYDAVELYEFARGWFSTDLSDPLPIPDWAKMVDDLGQAHGVTGSLGINLGGRFAKPVDASMIAVIAAISLGMDRESLLQVIKQNHLSMRSVISCRFSTWDTGYEEFPPDEHVFVPDDSYPVDVTQWHATNEIIQAISLDDALSKKMADEYSAIDSTYHISIACANSSNKAFWQKTHITDYLAGGSGIKRALENPVPFQNVKNCDFDLASMSDREVISLLDNAGNLMPECSTENGYDNMFFRSLFIDIYQDKNSPALRIPRALNAVHDETELERLNKNLLEKLIDYDYFDFTGGLPVLKGMKSTLSSEKYSTVMGSMVLKINATPLDRIYRPNSPEAEELEGTGAEELLHAPGSIFGKLATELRNIKPEDFRKGHFQAMDTFLGNVKHDQDLAAVDLNATLLAVMRGLEAYQATPHYKYDKKNTDEHKIMASAVVDKLVAWLTPKMNIDYSSFAGLSSPMKAILGSNGFDVRKLPNMTRQDRGQVLSDQLGL